MIPLEGEDLPVLVLAALGNCAEFNLAGHALWLKTQPGDVMALARKRPPNRLYRVITDNELEGQGAPLFLGVILGYRGARGGGPAECAVQVLGIREGGGAADDPLFLPSSALEDVTDRARAGKLKLT